MKHLFLTNVILISSLVFLMNARPVFAHILKTDHSIGAVLHIDPDDDPIAGQTANFFFELKDTSGRFKIDQCDCILSITENNKQIYAQPITKDAMASYMFPQRDVYQISLTGKPLDNSFQPFSLNWDLRVERTGTFVSTQSPNPVIEYFSSHFLLFIGGVVILGMCLISYLQKRSPHSS